MSDRRLALEAIAYGEDPRITPGDRMKALEMLAATEAAGEVSPAMAKVLAEVEQLTGDELDAELAGFMAAGWQPTEEEVMQQEVETRFRRAVRAWAKRVGRDPLPRRSARPAPPASTREEPQELPAPAPEPVALSAVQASHLLREDVRTQILRERKMAALPPGRRADQVRRTPPTTPEELWGDVPDRF